MSLAGISLALSFVASLLAGFTLLPQLVPGVLKLLAGLLLWLHVPDGVRRVSLGLLVVGGTSLMISPQVVSFSAVVSKNQQLIAMLAAIGLLRYAPQPNVEKNSPRGRKAVWQNLFGLHWLASVINISALAIFADRLVRSNNRLGTFQGIMLSRDFSLATF